MPKQKMPTFELKQGTPPPAKIGSRHGSDRLNQAIEALKVGEFIRIPAGEATMGAIYQRMKKARKVTQGIRCYTTEEGAIVIIKDPPDPLDQHVTTGPNGTIEPPGGKVMDMDGRVMAHLLEMMPRKGDQVGSIAQHFPIIEERKRARELAVKDRRFKVDSTGGMRRIAD